MQTITIFGDVFTRENNEVVAIGTIQEPISSGPTQEQIDAMTAFIAECGFTEDNDANWEIIMSWTESERKDKMTYAINLNWDMYNNNCPFNFGKALVKAIDWSDDEQIKEITDVVFFSDLKHN